MKRVCALVLAVLPSALCWGGMPVMRGAHGADGWDEARQRALRERKPLICIQALDQGYSVRSSCALRPCRAKGFAGPRTVMVEFRDTAVVVLFDHARDKLPAFMAGGWSARADGGMRCFVLHPATLRQEAVFAWAEIEGRERSEFPKWQAQVAALRRSYREDGSFPAPDQPPLRKKLY